MKLRIADRILAAVAGLLLLALCGGMVAQLFFQVDLTGLAGQLFSSEYPQTRWALIAVAAGLFLLGAYCFLVLFRHRRRKDRFILQKNDNGDLAISIKALENMVQKCIDQHDEIDVEHLHLENKKDGLLIRIRGSVAGGISIPLTVEAVQKQIRQYVTACSGVEIKGMCVQIDSSGEDGADAVAQVVFFGVLDGFFDQFEITAECRGARKMQITEVIGVCRGGLPDHDIEQLQPIS